MDIAEAFGHNKHLIKRSATMSSEINEIATRPNVAGLDTGKLESIIGHKLRDHRECLKEMADAQMSNMQKRS